MDMKKKGLIKLAGLVGSLLLSVSPVWAQQVSNTNLLDKLTFADVNGEQVIQIGLKTVLDLAMERATTIEIVGYNQQIAESRLIAARESNNPTLTNTVSHNRDLSASSLSRTDTTAVSSSYSKTDKEGITYGLTYQKYLAKSSTGNFDGDDLTGWSGSGKLHAESLTASVAVPIFQDWGDVNNIAEYQAQIGVEQTVIRSKQQIKALLQQVAESYWSLVGIGKSIEATRASVELSEQLVKDNQERMNLGVLDAVEVKQSESQLAKEKLQLQQEIVTQKLIEDQIRAALNLEKFPYSYQATEGFQLLEVNQEFNALLQEVFQHDETLALQAASLKSNQLDLQDALNGGKSDLDFSFKYQLNGYGDNLTKSTTRMVNTQLHGYQLGLTWKIPLSDRVTPEKIQRVKLAASRINLEISNQKSVLTVSLQGVLRNLKLSKQSIALAATSVDLSQDLLEQEIAKFNLGQSTSYRVAQAKQSLVDAQKQEIVAKVNYEKNYLSFLLVTDRLFDFYQLPELG